MTRLRGRADFQTFYKKLDDGGRRAIDDAGANHWAQPGEILIQQGDASETVLIIEEGVLEVYIDSPGVQKNAPLAYLGRGDIIGELGVLNSCARSATIRAVNDVHYRCLDKEAFLDLMETVPGLGLYMSYLLAERLAHTTSNLVYNSFCVDLSGKLPNFDLLAVLHTIEHSRCTGELKLIGKNKEALGSIIITESIVRAASYQHLRGAEALKQLLLEPEMEGAFSFRRLDKIPEDINPESRMNLSLMAFLLEAAIERDELYSLPSTLRTLDGTITAARRYDGLVPDLDGPALQIFQIIEHRPETLHSIWSRCNLSSLNLARQCKSLSDGGWIQYQA